MSHIECKDFVDKQNETILESAHEDKLLTFKLTRRNIMTCKTRCIINVKKRENAILVHGSYTMCISNFRHLFFFYGWHVSKMYHNLFDSCALLCHPTSQLRAQYEYTLCMLQVIIWHWRKIILNISIVVIYNSGRGAFNMMISY